jgi:DNA-binding response OmpR family regulator
MKKVMLVEDDLTMLSLLQTLLEIEGYQAIMPDDFAKTLELALSEKPDLVLIDVNLKGSNGLELLESLRAEDKLKGTKVIMSSGMDFSHECLQKGADDFIMKPYMPDDLIAKIKEYIGS